MPLSRRPRAALAAGIATSLLLAPLVALGVASPAAADITVPFARQFSANTNGSVIIRGNTLSTCDVAVPRCATAQASSAGGTADANLNNNNNPNVFVDVDGDPATFNSSSATVSVPTGGSVLYAALVWSANTATPTTTGGVAAPDASRRDRVQLRVPDAAAYQTVVADRVHELTAGQPGAYQGFVDVTEEVRAAGSGTYTVADVQGTRGSDRYAGWALVLAVSDPMAPARNLTVYTGFGSVTNTSGPVDIPVDGFLTPPSGPVKTSLGIVAYEGDQGSLGDALELNRVPVSDARNPANNIFNSSITDAGADTTGRTPSYPNQLGFDADQIAADGVLSNGASSASIRLTTGGETFYPGIVTFATDLYDPKLLGTKTVTDVDGGSVEPEDELRYEIPVQNIGLDTAVGSRLFDAIPTGTTYVPGSLTVGGAPVTDEAGDDTGAFVPDLNQGHVLVQVGTGATATEGGTVPVTSSAFTTVTFRVRVSPTATGGQELVNAAGLTYRGATTLAASASATNAVVTPVVAPAPANGRPTATSHILSFSPAPTARTLTVPVLEGDTDPENDPLTLSGVTDGAGGRVVANADGTITYSPRDDFAGRDVFTYTISDGRGGTDTATVQVDVVNDPPVATADTVTTRGGVAVDVPVLGNDTDADGDAISVRSFPTTTASGGTLARRPDGSLRYTPAAGFVGTESFTYVVEDTRGGSDTATVTVTVTNNAPVAVVDSYATQAGAPVPVAVRGNDTDADGHALTVTQLTQPSHGSVTLAADGTGTYTPVAGYSGPDSFTYRVTDSLGAQSAPVTVTLSVNAAPVAVADTASTPTDVARTLDVVGNDTDADDDDLVVTGVGQGSHGTVVLDAAGTVTYTPAKGWAGSDTYTYGVSDGRGGTATGTVTLTTDNAVPVPGDDAVATGPDASVTVDVLDNDTDANIDDVPGATQVLTVTSASASDGATVDLEDDGTLTVTPEAGFEGVLTVTYTVSDGADGTADGTLEVTVGGAAPVAGPDGPVSTPTDVSLLVDVLADDTDPNGDTLSIVPGSLTTPRDAGGTARGTAVVESGQVRYSPPAGFAGTVTFSYTATDDDDLTSTATVTVVVLNAPPVAVDDTASTGPATPVTVDVLGDDTDPNVPGTDQVLTVTGATADNGASVVVEADGRLTVTPAPGFKGTVVVTYTVSDGATGTDTGTLTVAVGDAAPVAGPDTATTAYATAVSVDLLDDDTDANGDTLSVVPGSLTPPKGADGTTRGSVQLVGGKAVYTPPAGFSGAVTFSYTVTDGELTSTATVTVTVGNAPPAAAPDQVKVPSTGGPTVLDVLGNDSDADGGTLRIVSVTQPGRGTVAVVDGKLVYTPEPGFTGQVTFTYTVADGQGGTSTSTVTLDVVAGPAGPAGPGTPSAPAAGSGSGSGAGSGAGSGSGSQPQPTRLARTGLETAGVALLGTVLLGLGAVAVAVGRPRPERPEARHRTAG